MNITLVQVTAQEYLFDIAGFLLYLFIGWGLFKLVNKHSGVPHVLPFDVQKGDRIFKTRRDTYTKDKRSRSGYIGYAMEDAVAGETVKIY